MRRSAGGEAVFDARELVEQRAGEAVAEIGDGGFDPRPDVALGERDLLRALLGQ